LNIYTTGLAGRSFVNQKEPRTFSSPGGEEKVRAGVNADFNENIEEQNQVTPAHFREHHA
jgi:hypothetical protein